MGVCLPGTAASLHSEAAMHSQLQPSTAASQLLGHSIRSGS